MNVIHHTMLPRRTGEGCCTQSVAGADLGRLPFEVEVQTVEANAATEETTAAAARVVLVLAGSGRLVLESGSQRFQSPCTLLIPAGASFQMINTATSQLQLVAVFIPCTSPEVAEP
jgi:mannose-6-phosphate isomerase-like protein (cupin superfamily)